MIRRTHDPAAGARRALAAGLAVAAVAWTAPAAAHGPDHAPRARAAAPSPGVRGAAALRPARVDPSTGVVAATGTVPLRILAADATAVVVAAVIATESLDDDRLRVHRLRVERVLRGRLDDAEPRLIDVRGASQRPPLVRDGERVVVLVRPAPDLSYLRQHLPAGGVVPVSGRDGVVRVTAEADVEAVDAAIGARTAGARRRLAFVRLASGRPRLAADGLLELRGLERLAPLSAEERAFVGRTLRDTRVPAVTRVGVLDLLAERSAREALPEVLAAETDTPALLDAVLATRARLGAPAGRTDLAPWLDADDAGVRAAALRALALLDDPAALDDLSRHATTDRDPAVRVAAIDALGQTKRPAVVPVLSKTFASADRELQQASARALLAVGGPAVDDALIALALGGDRVETKTYAALLLVTMHGRDHAAVRRLEASKPGPEVVKLLEHGLEFRHSHVH